jgi:type III secretory pathway lipoprotein EscJ
VVAVMRQDRLPGRQVLNVVDVSSESALVATEAAERSA